MKRIPWLLIFLLSLSVFQYQAFASDKTDFKKLMSEYYAAWESGQSENAAKFYAKDADLVFFDIAPFKYAGWDEYKAGSQKYFLDAAKNVKFILGDDMKITERGNITIVTTTFRLVGDMNDGSKIDIPGRQTSIWEKRKGGWMIIHEHISTPMPGIGPAPAQ